MPGVRARRHQGMRAGQGAVVAGLTGLACFSAFFLIRPFLGPLPPYGPRPAGTTYAYSFLVVAAFVPYALAVWGTRKGASLRTALIGTIILHGLVLPAALTQSQDLYMYLFYGKMWAVHGANPYVVEPLRFAADPWFPWVRWPDQLSAYGPVWTLISAFPAWVAARNLGVAFALMKGMALLLGVASSLGIVAASRASGVHPGRSLLLVAWNPIVIVSLPLGGHADVAVVAAAVWALVADRRGRPVIAAGLLAGAALVKAYAAAVLLVYLLALARRGRVVVPAVAASIVAAALAFAPFWEGWRTLEGLASVGVEASASLAGEVQRALSALAGPELAVWTVRIAGAAIVAAVIVVGTRRPAFRDDPWPTAAAAFVAYMLVSPWFLYWHQVGALALAAVAGSFPVRAAAVTFSGTTMLTASFGATPWGRAIQALIRYGPPVAALRLTQGGVPAPQRGNLNER